MLKEQSVKLSELRKTEIERRIVEVSQNISYSGECESVFRLKVAGLSGMLKIFRLHPKFSGSNSH